MMRGWVALAVGCVMLAGCGSGRADVASGGSTVPVTDWRIVATESDRARLRGWRTAWVAALAKVQPGAVAGEQTLFDPDRSLAGALPPPGAYRCRIYKLGVRGSAAGFSTSGWVACGVDVVAGRMQLSKTGGGQRPVGTIYPDTASRGVFLGTMVLGDERTPMTYGRDASRDMAGLIERIGERRWRLVLPYPRFESTLDVVELVPA